MESDKLEAIMQIARDSQKYSKLEKELLRHVKLDHSKHKRQIRPQYHTEYYYEGMWVKLNTPYGL